MTPAEWEHIQNIIEGALEHNPQQLTAYLENACQGDQELKIKIASMISRRVKADHLFEQANFLCVEEAFSKYPIEINKGQNLLKAFAEALSEVAKVDGNHHAWLNRFEAQQGFPIPDWDRYEYVNLIGEGGMGRVIKARDPRLGRSVALKFLRYQDSEFATRFLNEARAQARIEHENVCKVYEVGEVAGHHYIAMQYIDGVALSQIKDELLLEQKVKVIKDITEAIQAGHSIGLIHRDIKPANIMVERTQEGDWKPFVLDFGIARELGATSRTQTGMPIGTPSYMSPEQAIGDKNIDRRTDIYSLGATLYTILAGEPPFSGDSIPEILAKVVNDEPTSLKKFIPSITTDLETIVMKCLEKEPRDRYESARALANDLGFYLAGEPIQARRTSFTYRLKRKAVKNKVLVSVGSLALILLILLGAMGIRMEQQASKRSEMARRFGEEVKEMENIMRISHMMPLHDTSFEAEIVERRIKAIEAEMVRLGTLGEGPGHYAIGRGYLALRNYRLAQTHLAKAWQLGYRTPEAAYAFGQVMGELYREALRRTASIQNSELRRRREKEIEKEFLEPALNYLNISSGAQIESPAYVEGQIAFYKKDYQLALEKAREAYLKAPWLYEARRLEADIYSIMGTLKLDSGDNEAALQQYQKAGETYRAALAIADSDSTIYERECQRWTEILYLEFKTGKSPEKAYLAAIAAADQAIKADPASLNAYVRRDYAHLNWLDYQIQHGEDPSETLAKAIEGSQFVINRNPEYIDAYRNLSHALIRKGEYQISKGIDGRPTLDQAIEVLQKIIKLGGDPYVFNNLGLCYLDKGTYEMGKGIDPTKSLARSIECFEKIIALDTQYFRTYTNIGLAYKVKGVYEAQHAIDPRPSLNQAIYYYQKSIQLNPKNTYTYNNLGNTYKAIGKYEIAKGIDHSAAFNRALENYSQALSINPKNDSAYANNAVAHYDIASYLVEQRLDPTEPLQKARESIEKALKINPKSFGFYKEFGRIEIKAAEWAMVTHKSPATFLENARKLILQASELNSHDAELKLTLANYHLYQAKYNIIRVRNPRKDVDAGMKAIESALASNPDLAEAIAIKGSLYLLEAQTEAIHKKKLALTQQAKSSLEQALTENPLLDMEYSHLLTEAKRILVTDTFVVARR
ncbi:MAG: protein kinase [Acidobacteriota bacterium]